MRRKLLVLLFLATLAPMAAVVWVTTALLDRSLRLASTQQLEQLSDSLERTGRALYQQAQSSLLAAIEQGHLKPEVFSAQRRDAPADVGEFLESGNLKEFRLSRTNGAELLYLLRRGDEVDLYRYPLGVDLRSIRTERNQIRQLIERAAERDLRRGFLYTLLILAAAAWILAFVAASWWANRVTVPIRQLTSGLKELAAGNLSVRLDTSGARDEEVARATQAFNRTAQQLEESQDRLVQLTRLASWQALARKTAHEVKNSLTPIRLTMEELAARTGGHEDRFLQQAAQIVIEEVTSLERRVRAFSEFASEPPVSATVVNLNTLVQERLALLSSGRAEVNFQVELSGDQPLAWADPDLVRSILNNLLENATEAAGRDGMVLVTTAVAEGKCVIEIHDSGPGLSRHALESLFQPTISFKKSGMGLGLSIAKRSALLCQGDLMHIPGRLGGAAFRVILPRAGVGTCRPPAAEHAATLSR